MKKQLCKRCGKVFNTPTQLSVHAAKHPEKKKKPRRVRGRRE